MKNKARRKKELCAICGQALRKTTINPQERRGSAFYLFQNVPAQVCGGCGEIWIEEATLQKLDRLIKRGKPTRRLQTPVYDFSLASVK